MLKKKNTNSGTATIHGAADRAACIQASFWVGFLASRYGLISRRKCSGSSTLAFVVKACQLNAAKSIANGGKYSAKRFERNWAASRTVTNIKKNVAFSGSLPVRGVNRMYPISI